MSRARPTHEARFDEIALARANLDPSYAICWCAFGRGASSIQDDGQSHADSKRWAGGASSCRRLVVGR